MRDFRPAKLELSTQDASDLMFMHQNVASGEFNGQTFEICIGVGGISVNGRESGGLITFAHGERRDMFSLTNLFEQWLEQVTGEKVPK